LPRRWVDTWSMLFGSIPCSRIFSVSSRCTPMCVRVCMCVCVCVLHTVQQEAQI
jgi:hypothetical protein